MKFSLRQTVTQLENGIMTISGPALAVSGILAGIDLLTGGHLLAQVNWLTYAWAITLMLTLDFTVLILGVHTRRAYAATQGRWKKAGEIALAVLVAAAISFVSIQMQSIIARVNAEGISIDQAATQLGISMILLTWERSTLVLFLIFMSGFLRDEDKNEKDKPSLVTPLQHVDVSALSGEIPLLQVPQVAKSRFESKEQAILDALAAYPGASAEELADIADCSVRTAEKWMKRLEAHEQVSDTDV